MTTHPRRAKPEWAWHVQGLAATDEWWFITQEDRVWRLPKDGDLADFHPPRASVRSVGIPTAGIEHLGDCDYSDGHLYVAMEGTNPARIGMFRSDLEFVGSASVVDQGNSNPWCAVDPLTGFAYSSPFDTDHLVEYDRSFHRAVLDLRARRSVPLRGEDGARIELERVQGGTFTPDGRLYLSVDSEDGGIIGVDVESGELKVHHRIEPEHDWPEHPVVEGVAYIPSHADHSAPIAGQLHVLGFDAGQRRDDLWVRQYREQL